MILTEQLLQTGMFIANAQLDAYIKLINSSDSTVKYGEKHHIIPRSYYKLTGQKIDNSKANVVKLSYFEHILAHYYLSFCTNGKLKQANIGAFIMLVETGLEILSQEETIAISNLKNYAELTIAARAARQQHCKEIGKKQKTNSHREALKKARDLHSTTKGKRAIYNPSTDKVKFVTETELIDFISAGWQLGSRPLSEEAKAKIGRGNSKALAGKTHQLKQENQVYSGLNFNKVLCVETGQIFENIKAAAEWLETTVGIQGGQIKNCCAGARETTGGYHWQYIKMEN